MSKANELGTLPIRQLLMHQALPAAIGILTLSINGIIDNIFVGQNIGINAIGAIAVVLPITFLMASIGMSIGVGGASIVARALGAENEERAFLTFGNQILLTFFLAFLFLGFGLFFQGEILLFFGGKGEILPFARTYFAILLPSTPLLAWAMMSNNIIRAEGKPKIAMGVMLVPALMNIVLDYLFIILLDWGMAGAAWATMISYCCSGLYAAWYFFLSGKSSIKLNLRHFNLDWNIIKEIFSIGSVTLSRQGVISILAIVLNNALFESGGEEAIAIWGIINRMVMFANFPVYGINQGVLPIAGFNYGAKLWLRVREVIRTAIISGTLVSLATFTLIMLTAPWLVKLFGYDSPEAVNAMRIVFAATPTLMVQLLGATYYQAIGKARPALLLTLCKQGFFLIPLILILPQFIGLTGIWVSFVIADILTCIVNGLVLNRAMIQLKAC